MMVRTQKREEARAHAHYPLHEELGIVEAVERTTGAFGATAETSWGDCTSSRA